MIAGASNAKSEFVRAQYYLGIGAPDSSQRVARLELQVPDKRRNRTKALRRAGGQSAESELHKWVPILWLADFTGVSFLSKGDGLFGFEHFAMVQLLGGAIVVWI